MAQASDPSVPAPDLSRLRIERGPARPRSRSRALVWVVVAALLGAAAWAFRDRLAGSLPGAAAPEVSVATVRRTGPARASEVVANGYVVARRRAALSTVLSGRLVEVNVEEGDEVKENDVVARIQHDDYDAALAAAKKATAVAVARRDELQKSLDAARLDSARLRGENRALADLVEQARSTAERAARDVERNRPLFEKKVIDGGTWDRLNAEKTGTDAALDAARSRVEAGEAALEAWEGEIARRAAALATGEAEVARALQAEAEAAILVDKTYVRAPFAGIVVHKDAEVGEVVAATGFGTNTRGSVATIVDTATLEVQVELTETRSATVEEGNPAVLHVEATPEKGWKGRVRQVWPTADRQKGTVEVRVEFLERPPVLKPEMGVRVTFQPKERPGAEPPRVLLPRRALARRGERDVVFVVQGDVARRREVATKPAAGEDVEVTSGLEGGERVVVDPPSRLDDGAKVRARAGP
jgi:RND family efflux transporter MFP subunit